jgi:hypothetical protein
MVLNFFDDVWFAKHYIEQGNELHTTIKDNAPLQVNAY